MLSSIFKSISKPFERDSTPAGGDTASRPGDRVDDDFLLVGQTRSERTTVHAENFSQNPVQMPPAYLQACQASGLPSYSEYRQCEEKYSPVSMDTPFFSQGQGQQTSHSGVATSCVVRSPIDDISFKLGGVVEFSAMVEEIKRTQLLQQSECNMSAYEYDFRVEMSFLAAHNDDNSMDHSGINNSLNHFYENDAKFSNTCR